MSVVWTATGRATMDAAAARLAVHSARAAAGFVRRVERQLDLADTLPYIGAAVDPDDPDFRELYEAPYRIIYQVTGSDVTVVTLVYARRGA